MKLSEAAKISGGKLVGDPEFSIQRLSSLGKASCGCLTFDDKINLEAIKRAREKGAAVICRPGLDLDLGIESEKPYLAFVKVMKEMSQKESFQPHVHRTAVVSESSRIGKDVYIGPGAVVSDGAEVGDECVIEANCYIGKFTRIGSFCRLYPNVTVLNGCEIGNRVVIHPGAVVGGDGFGYLREGGEIMKIPQLGKVVIEDDVEIGANSAVDRAMLDATVIKKGTKIDNLVQVAHNVVIGENCLIASQTGISGSVEVGPDTLMAGQVGIADHAKIGKNVVIMAKSGVAGDIPDNSVFFWIPAMEASKAKRIVASLKFLPEMAKKLRKIGK
ncbi:UDP-3-O-(3-hydroxymyristoyl)glucosamine N-acyltransferase [candidate division WOR-3 bacterium]|nr:UDP-3-O-(3-hydroxymyristoyl)glucosamine N-acyltransferase [candidate division WOR-3 bacterium]